jgi:hypothetical protein
MMEVLLGKMHALTGCIDLVCHRFLNVAPRVVVWMATANANDPSLRIDDRYRASRWDCELFINRWLEVRLTCRPKPPA